MVVEAKKEKEEQDAVIAAKDAVIAAKDALIDKREEVMREVRREVMRELMEKYAECLEDRLGIMVGDGKAAFGRRRSAPTGRHTKSTAGTTAQATAATQVAGRAPKRRSGGCRGAAVRLEPQSPPYRRR